MRTDDPVILNEIRKLEAICESLRRICGFEPLRDLPETTASRAPKWCPVAGCAHGSHSKADLEHHLATEHAERDTRQAIIT